MSTPITQELLRILLDKEVIDGLNPSTGTGWIGVEGLRPNPDTIVAVLHAGGRDPNPAWNIDYPHMQLITRSHPGDYSGVSSKMWEVRKALLGMANYHVPGSDDIWASIRVISDMIPMGPDESGRERMSLNLELITHTSDLGNRSDIA